MNKTPCVFERKNFLATPAVTPGCEWVLAGEGVATRKWDGTCCMVKDGVVYARRTIKGYGTPPEGWIPYSDRDATLGDGGEQRKRYGWVFAPLSDSKAWYTPEVLEAAKNLPDGTYELCGPKIQKNIECFRGPTLRYHGDVIYNDAPRDFEGLKAWLTARPHIEGLVFHHPDGRRAKLRGVDFGVARVPSLGGME